MDKNSIQIIPYEMDYVNLSSNNADAQLLETREFNTKEICRFFGVNPALIQDNTASSYNTLEQINLQFLQYTLMPYIQMIETELSRKIFIDEDDYYVDMDEDKYLMRTDKSSTAQYYGQFIEKGVMSVNEVRKELGMNELSDGGNDHFALYTDTNKSKINKI
jgi:HK97 family phage portal protein